MKNNDFVIIRTYNAGVHMGYLTECTPTEGGYHVTLEDTRRIWSWTGANSLSELGNHGSMSKTGCNITMPLVKNKMVAIEIIYCTDEAQTNLESIPEWKFKKS